MNDKMQDLSKSLLGLHVTEVLKKKDEEGLKLRDLSEDEKEKIRNLFKDLEKQVNEFVNKTQKKEKDLEEEMEVQEKKTRTTLRDKIGNKNKK